MKGKKFQHKGGSFWNAISVAFSRIPFFEIAYVTIIGIIIWRLPDILTSLSTLIRDKETFCLGVGVCTGLFVLVGFCVGGIISRAKFYKIFSEQKTGLRVVDQTDTQNDIDKIASTEIERAFEGKTDG